MSSNSFYLKNWAIVLVSALFALDALDEQRSFIYLAYYPSLACWILDAYFLQHERLFRRLYDHVRLTDEKKIDFCMTIAPFKNQCQSWPRTMWSQTLLIFYGMVMGAIVLVMVAVD